MDVFNISVVLYTQPLHIRLLYSACSWWELDSWGIFASWGLSAPPWALLSGGMRGGDAGKAPSSAWRGFGFWCQRQPAHSLPSWLHLRPNFSFFTCLLHGAAVPQLSMGPSEGSWGAPWPPSPEVLWDLLCSALFVFPPVKACRNRSRKAYISVASLCHPLGIRKSHWCAISLRASPAPSGSIDLTLIGL